MKSRGLGMKLSLRNRNQTATRWTPVTTDIYGNSSYTLSTLKVRWEDKQIKTTDFRGNEIISNAIVYTGEDIGPGDYLYLGTSTATTPPYGAREVRNFNKSPNLAATDYIRKAVL